MERKVGTSTGTLVNHPSNPERFIPVAMNFDRGSHAYGYTNGVLTTDTWTVDGKVFVKTFTYTNGVLAGETDWVPQ